MMDARLEEAIIQTKARLVVLDPIQGFLGTDVDMHRANEIRPLMKRVAVLAEKYHCAIILIGHMNKNSNGKSSYRGLGSIDFQAAARSVLIVGRIKDEPEIRVVCHVKSSLAPEGKSIAFRLDKDTGFEWIGEYDISADDLLSGDNRGQKIHVAKEFLQEFLVSGSVAQTSNTDINSSNVGGLYSYYKPAIQQARAILSLNFQSHNEKNGENEKGFVYTIPYTINMETLFEYYARTELKKALKGSEYRVEQYSKKLYLQKDIDNVDDAEKGIHLMSFCIPDIIIYKEDKPVVVIDAKYKLSGRPDRSDSHQLLSYVLLTGADRCGFVLPGEKTEVKEMVSTGDNYLPLAPRILRYYELLLGSKSDSSELQKVLQ